MSKFEWWLYSVIDPIFDAGEVAAMRVCEWARRAGAVLRRITVAVWRAFVYVATWRAPFVGSKITKEQLHVATKRHDAERKRLEKLTPEQKRIARERHAQRRA